MLGLVTAMALCASAGPASVAVVPSSNAAALSKERLARLTARVADALSDLGLPVKVAEQACPATPGDCVGAVASALSASAVVVVDAGEVRGNVALQILAYAVDSATPIAEASFVTRAGDRPALMSAALAGLAQKLSAELNRKPVDSAPAPAPAREPEPAPGREPEPATDPAPAAPAQAQAPPNPKPVVPAQAPAPVVEVAPRESGALVFLRADVDLMGGVAPALGGGYRWGLLGLEATALVSRRSTGARVELMLLPFNWNRIKPYVSAGAVVFFAPGWGGSQGATPLGAGPRGVLGAELSLGNFKLRVDLGVEWFAARNQPEAFRPLAVLLGAAAGWLF